MREYKIKDGITLTDLQLKNTVSRTSKLLLQYQNAADEIEGIMMAATKELAKRGITVIPTIRFERKKTNTG